MKSQQIAMALVESVHLDAEFALDISLSKEVSKCKRIAENSGIQKLIEWLELKLAWALNPKLTIGCVEYSGLRALALAETGDDKKAEALAIEAFAYARQIVSCLRKTRDIPCKQQESASLSSWCDRNAEMRALSWEQLLLADELRSEMRALIPEDLSLADLVPSAGPGATCEKREHRDRPFFYTLKWASFQGSTFEPVRKASRPTVVPKDWKKNRLVMVEPSSLMLAQKSLQKWLMDQARSSPMGKYCDFLDQGFQRKNLLRPEMASIDLSDASDRVNRLLVWRVFSDRPVLRSALFEARSQETVDGVPIRMFSTMGNATTFVVMTYLLVAVCRVCESVVRHRGVRIPHSSVFGDDIVCSNIIYGSVVELLQKLGFSVNLAKSYCVGDFRESCGLDLFKGHDVTPTKVKSLAAVTRDDFRRLLAYANDLFLRGLWRASEVVANAIRHRWRVSVGYIGSVDTLVSHTAQTVIDGKFSKKLQTVLPYLPSQRRPVILHRDGEAMLQYALANGGDRKSVV